ncbi:MAG: tyrosine-protein phosphatase [Rhodococcus sp. (in: high G+C Gram-positive bacteria)]|uniref:tyrosine-protein phosphatase n=1 Tax=Rhodococcus sp. TaxID=1831 RepID=UPI003BB57E2C
MTTLDFTLTAPVNLRDLGGIPISGGILRTGLAIRSDDLSTITPAHARDLASRGLVSVIDLRSNDEVALTGRGPLSEHAIAYHHLPLMSDIRSAGTADEPFPTSRAAFGEMYATMMESAAPQLVSALAIIAVAPGTTAFHCAAGADRTGVLAAALLLTLGAADDDIVADYGVTGTNMDAITARLAPVMGVLLARLGFDFEDAAAVRSDEAWDVPVRSMLALLRDRHGDALAPLRAAGLGDDTVALLRRRALTS